MPFTVGDKLLNLAKVFSLADAKVLTLRAIASLTKYSYWHLTRLYKRYRQDGLKNLFRQEQKRKPRRLKEKDLEFLKRYYLTLGKPQISLLLYFLGLDHPSFPKISGEWARKVLIREGLYSAGERRKVFRRRFEAPFPGILIQGDSSYEQWLPGDERYYHLIVFLDDCSRLCLGARLVARDTIAEHFTLLKEIVEKHGKFITLYYDNDEKYSYIRHGNSRFFTYTKETADLQVVRALTELGISVINSRPGDPHGKGKIERFIETAQLQLPVWFRRYKVKTLESANRVVDQYIKYYNEIQHHRELGSTPMQKFQSLRTVSKFTKPDPEKRLNRIFSYRYERKVERDNTIRFHGAVYQLKKRASVYSYSGKKAELRYLPNVPLAIYIDGKEIENRKLLTITKRALRYERLYDRVAIL